MDDDRKLDGSNQEGFPYDERPPVTLDFTGGAKIKKPRRFKASLDLELISDLNSKASKISDEIKQEMKSTLPTGVDITVNIEFSSGSIEWAGVIALADWMARLSGSANFVEYAIRAAKFAINKVVRSQIEEKAPIKSIYTTVELRKDDPFHPITRFLWWCSGTVEDLIRDSRTDKAKYEGIGGAILTTGVLAVFSGFYAIYTMFQGGVYSVLLAIVLGVIWGLVIFNLDRYIVSSMRKENEQLGNRLTRFLKELPPAFPRLLLAAVIGVTLSKPLELRLFQQPINEQVDMIHDQQLKEKEASLQTIDAWQLSDIDNEIDQINTAVSEKEGRVKYLQDEFHKESDSTGGSRRYGYSTVAKIKQASFEQAKKDANEFELSKNARKVELQSKKGGIENDIRTKLESFKKNLGNDFLTKMRALSVLTKQHDAVWWANYFVIFLLILIEITPVLVKLISPSGPYDVKFNMRNDAESREAELRRDAVTSIAEYHYRRLIEAENRQDDVFFEMRADFGDHNLRRSFQQWQAQFNFGGRGPTFEEFLRFVKDNVFSHRTP